MIAHLKELLRAHDGELPVKFRLVSGSNVMEGTLTAVDEAGIAIRAPNGSGTTVYPWTSILLLSPKG